MAGDPLTDAVDAAVRAHVANVYGPDVTLERLPGFDQLALREMVLPIVQAVLATVTPPPPPPAKEDDGRVVLSKVGAVKYLDKAGEPCIDVTWTKDIPVSELMGLMAYTQQRLYTLLTR